MSDESTRMQDIAKLVGVSTSTVSRALQKPEMVAPQTREKIRQAIDSAGYVPNQLARSLRTARRQVLLVVVPEINSSFYAQFTKGAEEVADRHGYSVLLGDVQLDTNNHERFAQFLKTKQADGVITFAGAVPFAGTATPLVQIGQTRADVSVPSIDIDNEGAMTKAAEHLLHLGHRDIAFLNGPSQAASAVARLAGYRSALQAAGIENRDELVASGFFGMEPGSRATEKLLALHNRPTAILCANDEMAIGAMHACHSHGLKIPDDISIVGFDDIQVAKYLNPPLTTTAQPVLDLGRQGTEMLIALVQGEPIKERHVILPTRFIERKSTASPALN